MQMHLITQNNLTRRPFQPSIQGPEQARQSAVSARKNTDNAFANIYTTLGIFPPNIKH